MRYSKERQQKDQLLLLIIIIVFPRAIGRANLFIFQGDRQSDSVIYSNDKWMMDQRSFLKDIQTKLDDELTDL